MTDAEGHAPSSVKSKDAISFVNGATWVIGGIPVIAGTMILSGRITAAFH